jgi:hypothetical protein
MPALRESQLFKRGMPEEIRTPDLLVRSQVIGLRVSSAGLRIEMWGPEDLTAYNFAYSDVDEKPGGEDISLKRLVGTSGFEPPAS